MFFVQRREKLTHDLLNFVEKYARIMHFSNFLKRFFGTFRKLSGPRTPTRSSKKCHPPNQKSGYAHENLHPFMGMNLHENGKF